MGQAYKFKVGKMNTPQSPAPTNQLAANMVIYMIMRPGPVTGPNGETMYQMVGPFADLPSASQMANKMPGALLCAQVVLFETPRLPPASSIITK